MATWLSGGVDVQEDRPRELTTTHTITPRLPLEEAAEGYRAMDERRAIKTLLRP
jgi:threonine dehydrogenase-like Zn-dependent dehydrogenase